MLKKHSLYLGLVLGLVFLLRVLYFFTVVYPAVGEEIRKPDGYWVLAENLLNGRGYVYDAYTAEMGQETARRGPLPTLLFVVLFWMFGVSPWPVLILQWGLCAGIGWLIYKIVLQLMPGQTATALLAVGLYAVFWPEFKFTAEARSEIVFAFFLAAAVFALLKAFQVGQLRWFAWAGLLLGLAQHTKPVLSPFPVVVLCLLVVLQRPNWRQVAQRFAMFTIAFALVILPWVVRNYLLFNKIIPGTTLLGLVIYHDFRDHLFQNGFLQDATGQWLVPTEWIVETTSTTDYRLGKSEVELDALWMKNGLNLIQRYPGEFVLWAANNATRFWFNLGRSKWDHPNSTGFSLTGLINGVALGLAILGVALTRKLRRGPVLLVLLLILYYSAIHAFTSGELRYSQPLAPFLLCLAAVTLTALWGWLRKLWQYFLPVPTQVTQNRKLVTKPYH